MSGSIKQKFILVLGMIALATLLSGIVSMVAVETTTRQLRELEESKLKSLLLARDARSAFQRYSKDIEVALSNDDDRVLANDEELVATLHQQLAAYRQLNQGSDTEVDQTIDLMADEAMDFVRLSRTTGRSPEALNVASMHLRDTRLQVTTALNNLEAQANGAFQSHLHGINQQEVAGNLLAFGLVGAMTAAVVVAAARILARILRRIRQISAHFAATDLDKIQPLAAAAASDELNDLVQAANRMLMGMKDSRRELVDKKLIESVMEALDDALLVADRDGAVVWANHAASRMLKVALPALPGTQLLPLLKRDEHTRADDTAQIARAVAAGYPVHDELLLDLPGSEPVPIHLIAAPLPDLAASTLFVLRDLTNTRADEARLKEVHGQLVQSSKLASLGTLGAGVAHELNNPLTAVIGFAELLGVDAIKADAVKEVAGKIVRAATRMRKIVDHLRIFAADTARQPKTSVLLNDVINDSLILLNKQFVDQGIELEINLATTLPPVLGDANQLESVVQNLLTNARDALTSLPDGRSAKITITTEMTATGRVAVAIADNGHGIKECDRQRIFEPFFTTKDVGKGTGLGLSITHAILKDHSGVLSFTTELGAGTCFLITFPPLPASAQPAAPRLDLAAKPTNITARAVKRSILVIDDEEMIGEVLLAALGGAFEVTYMHEPIAACERFLAGSFDLLITDVRMPGMNGLEVIETIRASRPEAKILVMTGHAKSAGDVKMAMSLGALGVISKPLPKLGELHAIIDAALAGAIARAS